MLDNHFQNAGSVSDAERDSAAAESEHSDLASRLNQRSVAAYIVPSSNPLKDQPDAIFPNNSLSFHLAASSSRPVVTAYLYPMSPGRRDEVPTPLLGGLTKLAADAPDTFRLVDLRRFEQETSETPALVLEGTGALVFSHDASTVYVGRSQRAHLDLVKRICATPELRFPELTEVHHFEARDRKGRVVYHTNVVGWNGARVAGWCLDALSFDSTDLVVDGVRFVSDRHAFTESFERRGVQLLELTYDEIDAFAGNALELYDGSGRPILTLSAAAWAGLRASTRDALEAAYGGDLGILSTPIPTIERLGGGSVRCLQCHLTYRVDESGRPEAAAVDALRGLLGSISLHA